MSLVIRPEQVPLEADRDGVIRAAGTRVTLDTLVSAYLQGASAEEIAEQYPAVALSDLYAVIGYYLHHREEVERYLAERRRDSEAARREIETEFPPSVIRERILNRRPSKG